MTFNTVVYSHLKYRLTINHDLTQKGEQQLIFYFIAQHQ